MRKLGRKLTGAARRITGFSTPIGGLEWQPPRDEVDILRELLVALEDRRALYTDYTEENQSAVYKSVEKIREALTQAKSQLPEESRAMGHLTAMRAACRKYCDTVQKLSRGGGGPYHVSYPDFYEALGAFRAIMGLQIFALVQMFGIQVESSLTAIFPPDKE